MRCNVRRRRYAVKEEYYFNTDLDTIYTAVNNMSRGYDALQSAFKDVETVMDEAPELAEDTYAAAEKRANQYWEWANQTKEAVDNLGYALTNVQNGTKSRRFRRSRKADVNVTGVDDLVKQITGGQIMTTNTQGATTAVNKLMTQYKAMLQAANDLLKTGVAAEVVAAAINAQVAQDFKA
jgi:ElaB/YqjD/DUF883 family membrane-anchored ribosome-binding protein